MISFSAPAQSWTIEELKSAHTAVNITKLTTEEKEVIKYINLARMYPAKFAEVEVKNYVGPEESGDYLSDSRYKISLYNQLKSSLPVLPLQFDDEMYELAKCFAYESAIHGIVGHKRKNCIDGNLRGECCDYGNNTGKDVALSLLIDHDVPSLGHREICLSTDYKRVGVKMASHTKYRYCTVLDFR